MTRFIDTQNRVLEITMIDIPTGLPWEHEFFNVLQLDMHPEEKNAYMVRNIMYLLDEAVDFCKSSTLSTCKFHWHMLY